MNAPSWSMATRLSLCAVLRSQGKSKFMRNLGVANSLAEVIVARLTQIGIGSAVAIVLAMSGACAAVGMATAQPVLRLNGRFEMFGIYAPQTAGRYAYLSDGVASGSGELIDDSSHRTFAVPADPECNMGNIGRGPVAGGRSIVMLCRQDMLARYPLPDGPWTDLPSPCVGTGLVTCIPMAVGDRWVEIQSSCDRCGTTTVVESLTDPHVARTVVHDAPDFVNLNDRDPIHQFCPPVHVLSVRAALAAGQFVVLLERHHVAIQRCGTQRPTNVVGNYDVTVVEPGVVMWWRGDRKLGGIFLPSRRHFTEDLPSGFGSFITETATTSRMYIEGTNGGPHTWVGLIPRLPPRTHNRPRSARHHTPRARSERG